MIDKSIRASDFGAGVSEVEDDHFVVEAEVLLASTKGQVSNNPQRQSLVWNNLEDIILWGLRQYSVRTSVQQRQRRFGGVFLDKHISCRQERRWNRQTWNYSRGLMMRRRNRIVPENLLNSLEIFFCRDLRTI